jgi:hypothetical protein
MVTNFCILNKDKYGLLCQGAQKDFGRFWQIGFEPNTFINDKMM